jgi:hypothetical protein
MMMGRDAELGCVPMVPEVRSWARRLSAFYCQEVRSSMQPLLEWLHGQPYFLTVVQIVLDVVLIAMVLIYFTRRPKGVPMPEQAELLSSFEKIIQETKEIAEAFDANLQERQQLIEQLLAQLDLRLEEAQKGVDQVQAPLPLSLREPSFGAPTRNVDQQEILRLARQGLDAETIAQRLKKPRGEVDLILKLGHMTKRPELA